MMKVFKKLRCLLYINNIKNNLTFPLIYKIKNINGKVKLRVCLVFKIICENREMIIKNDNTKN